MTYVLSLAEDDGDVAEALLDTRRPTHRARAPATHVLVRGLVDERGLDEESVDVDAGALRLGVGNGALDELLEDRSRGFVRELEQLQRLARLTAADEVHDDAGFARTDPREPGDCLADHGRILGAFCRTHGHRARLLAARAVTDAEEIENLWRKRPAHRLGAGGGVLYSGKRSPQALRRERMTGHAEAGRSTSSGPRSSRLRHPLGPHRPRTPCPSGL